jgi:AcrR family transcriptional regulator
MRAVATEVGSSAMALYRYFPTKDDLVEVMLDRVLSRVHLPDPTPDWLGNLRAIAEAHRQTLFENSWAIGPLFSHPDPGPGAQRIGEAALGALAEGGIVGADALAAFSAMLALNYGWASFAAAGSPALGAYAAPDNYDRALGLLLAGIAERSRLAREERHG